MPVRPGTLLTPVGALPRPFSLPSLFFSGGDGLLFDFTKYDGQFQENTGPTAADDVGEVIGLSPDRHSWSGASYSAILAAQPELVTNGGFDSASGWTVGSGCSIAAGKATWDGSQVASSLTYRAVTGGVSGDVYASSYSISGRTAGGGQLRFGQSSGAAFSPFKAGDGAYSEFVTLTNNLTDIGFLANADFAGSADDISAKKLPGHHGLQSSSSLRPTVQTTGAKFDGADDNLLTNYTAGSGANYIVALVTVPATLAATQIIAGVDNAGVERCYIGIRVEGWLCAGVGAQGVATIRGSTDLRGQDVVVGLSFDGSTVKLFHGNIEAYSAAQSGSANTATGFRLGSNNSAGTANSFFAGSIKKLVAGREALTLSRYRQIRNAMLAS